MDKAIQALETAGVPNMPRDEAVAYLSSVLTSAFMLLRTFETTSYVRGWLDSAVDDLQHPPAFRIRSPS